MKRTALALLATLGLATSVAHAVEYNQVQAEKSQIAFGFQQMGVSMDGSFKKFSSQLRFDPAALQAATASIEVELASVDTGSAEGDGEVARKTWFNTKDFPVARFQSRAVKALGGNRYEVAGTLTIKGTSKDVAVPATFTPQGDTGVFEGSLTIQRGDFSIGEGAWKAFDIVANDVVIKFRITAAAK
jgi:polyisoprenoid-binding protein YceI